MRNAFEPRFVYHRFSTYFGPKGIEYNMIRVPIGGCDFSTHPYTYNEHPWYDTKLTNYSLTEEDLFFKVRSKKRWNIFNNYKTMIYHALTRALLKTRLYLVFFFKS